MAKVKKLKPRVIVQNHLPLFEGNDNEQAVDMDKCAEQWIRRKYPMTEEERTWLPEGVRLARFVSFAECRQCRFATVDHTEKRYWPSLICLKDLRAKEAPK